MIRSSKTKGKKVKRILWPQADIVSNGDFIKVQTYSDLGLSTLDHLAPAHVLAPDASDEDLGHALLAALSLSRLLDFDDPAYTDEVVEERYKEWIHDMMKSYGYKTERALFRKMDTCGAMIRDGVLTIRPSYHYALGGWSGDFITEEDYIKIPENSPATAVGAALRLALGRCKTKGF
jgi:hypothetical protein